MLFTIRRYSTPEEEQRDIASLEELVALMAEHRCELHLAPNGLFDRIPIVWICDRKE